MRDNDTKLQEIKNKIKAFVDSRGWTESHSPKHLAMSIAIEAAELMEIFQWLSVEEASEIYKSEEFTHLKEELADVLIYCCSLANGLNIDISEAIEDKLNKNALRFPEKNN